ncbi:Vti1a [Phodopus roborovskii]|uniref:Vti1a protein n=1 Tax=Phodopus roborovskii TaxID=109678 RepID=A0AAU9ZXV2_PHORO|nr:Vti1a [Phodopus roborovskii]
MSSDFEGYEQDFAVLTAEITSKISRVPRLPPDEKKQMVANVEKQLEEARELLEQMDLEVREIPPQSRGMYSNRMRSYKQEMGKLEAEFKQEVKWHLLGWGRGTCSLNTSHAGMGSRAWKPGDTAQPRALGLHFGELLRRWNHSITAALPIYVFRVRAQRVLGKSLKLLLHLLHCLLTGDRRLECLRNSRRVWRVVFQFLLSLALLSILMMPHHPHFKSVCSNIYIFDF